MQNQNTTVIFCRVSSKEQEEIGYSLPSQEKYLTEYCERKGLEINKVFSVSESASGKKQRDNFLSMLKYVEKNKLKLIVCEKADRFTRNFRDMVKIDEWLEADESRQIHLVKDSLILHKHSKSQEKLNWGIRILFAKNYIDNLSEEVKKGNKEKVAQGWSPRKPLAGYLSIGERRHKTQILDEKMAPLIRRMFELYASGNYSLKALTEIINTEGLRIQGRPMLKSRVHMLLQNPYYYGKILWHGDLYDGKHEPIITKELFDEVQKVMKRQTGSDFQYKKHLPVFKAKVTCSECGGLLTWEKQKGNWYGHCTKYRPCSQKKYIRQDKVEEQIFPWIDEPWFDHTDSHKRIYRWLESVIQDDYTDETSLTEAKRQSLEDSLKKLNQRLSAIYDDKIDGVITADFYEQKKATFTTEQKQLTDELNKLNQDNSKHYLAGVQLFDLICDAKKIYYSPKANDNDRRLLLSYLFSNFAVLNGTLAPKLSPATEFLLRWVPSEFDTFELENIGEDKTKTASFEAVCPVVCTRQDSNPRPSGPKPDALSTELRVHIVSTACPPWAEATDAY